MILDKDVIIKDKIFQILADQAQVNFSELSLTSSLVDLGIDSVGVVEIIFKIEEEFDITIPYNSSQTPLKNVDFSRADSIVELVSNLIVENQSS